ARLARGLATVVERLGVPIHEQTEVTQIAKGLVRTTRGDVRAELVVRGTEAYTVNIRGEGRRIQPITSQVVATDPLPAAGWDQLGFARREVAADMVTWGMSGRRTTADRIALGGGGGFQPRRRGLDEAEILDPRVFKALRDAVRELFPAAAGARFTHAWGGVW